MANELHDIVTPHEHDVLSGRGNFVNYHAGNEHFRALVRKHKVAYVACPKPQKGKFSRIIVDEIRSRNPPGRFLKQDPNTKLWNDIGEKKALDKTRQALREGAPDLVKELGVEEDEGDGTSSLRKSGGPRSSYGFDSFGGGLGGADLKNEFGGNSGLLGNPMHQLSKQSSRQLNDPFASNFQQIQQLAQQQQTLSRKIGSLGLGQQLGAAMPPSLSSGVTNPYSRYNYDMDDLEPRPIDPMIAARNKVQTDRPKFPREQSEQSLKLDEAFSTKVEYGKLDGTPKGQLKKLDDSQSQISVMSMSDFTATDEGNLSAMFDSSLHIGDSKHDDSRHRPSSMLGSSNSKKKDGNSFLMDTSGRSINSFAGDDFSALGSLNQYDESQADMSYSNVFDDIDKK